MGSVAEGGASITALPLFPLRLVLFPDGVLRLKVFEARYLDLVSQCLRHQQAFGVVCLRQGAEVRADASPPVRFERKRSGKSPCRAVPAEMQSGYAARSTEEAVLAGEVAAGRQL